MNLSMDAERFFSASLASPSSGPQAQRPKVRVVSTPSSNTSGVRAPWWTVFEFASNDEAVAELTVAYAHLARAVDQLAADEDEHITPDMAATARAVLARLRALRVVAPRMTWHAEGIVLTWRLGRCKLLYTVYDGQLDVMLQMSDGQRRSQYGIPAIEWARSPLH